MSDFIANRKKENIWQFLKFLMVGISNTLISEVIYVVLVLFGWNYLLSSLVGFVISVLNAYYWSSRYVFREDAQKEKRVWWQVLFKTYAAYFWGFLVNAVLLVFWVDIIRIGGYLGSVSDWLKDGFGIGIDAKTLGELTAEGVNLLMIVPMNYLVNKYWAYRQKNRSVDTASGQTEQREFVKKD